MKPRLLFKDKRGIALETAILFMVLVFSFCSLMSAVALTGHYQRRLDKSLVLTSVDIEQIGEDFVYAKRTGEEMPEYEDYRYEIEGNSLFVYNKKSDKLVLYVLLSDDGAVIAFSKEIPDND